MIICVNDENERIITIHESLRDGEDTEIIVYDPRGFDRVWGKLSYTVEDRNDTIADYNPGPHFTIYGLDSYVSDHSSRNTMGLQRGVGAVLISLAAAEAQRIGHAMMYIFGSIGAAVPFYRKVGFDDFPDPIGCDMQRGPTADVMTRALAQARKYSWSV